MTSRSSAGVGPAQAFAVAGGVVFVLSLAFGAWSYASPFGADAARQAASADDASVLFDVLIFSVFALHHSVFARTGVRAWIASHVPAGLERSLYVWIASVLFIALMAAWRPVAGEWWRASPPLSLVLGAIQIAGVILSLRASAALDVWSLSGIRQAFGRAELPSPPLVQTGLYAVVRHPIYLAWILMVWPAPAMTNTRLVFAIVSTLYLAAAVPFEERSLRRQFGPAYAAYAARVRWKMVPGLY